MNLAGFDRPRVCKKKIFRLYSPILKVHSTKTSVPLRFSELGKQRASKNSVYSTWEACSKIIIFTVRVRSLEKKLEDLAGLSPNYWLTKFVQEIANKNEIVNSARGMFTEFRNAFESHFKRKGKQQTVEIKKLCLSCVLLFLIGFQTHVF